MTDFHNINLPRYIAIFAVGTSEFSTICASTKSGREIRSASSSRPKRSYVLKDCRLSREQFEAFHSFFSARCGRRFSFLLRDYCDYKVKKQIIAKGDGNVKEFQLIKTYLDPVASYVRKITNPVANTISVYLGENQVVSAIKKQGIIELPDPPGEGVDLFASCEFDVPVRFANDKYQYSFNNDGTVSLNDVNLTEVIF